MSASYSAALQPGKGMKPCEQQSPGNFREGFEFVQVVVGSAVYIEGEN